MKTTEDIQFAAVLSELVLIRMTLQSIIFFTVAATFALAPSNGARWNIVAGCVAAGVGWIGARWLGGLRSKKQRRQEAH